MDLVTGAMGALVGKLGELLLEKYNLQRGARQDVLFLESELRSMHAALRKVAEVPRDQLDEQVKLWTGEVRELSYEMEDVVDTFLVRVDEPAADLDGFSGLLQGLKKKMVDLFNRGMARHQVADAMKEFKNRIQEVADRRKRCKVDDIVVKPAAVDPRVRALYTEATELIGVHGRRDQELMKLLSEGDDASKMKLKIVSVVGFGGLGKTTLVKTVYDKIKGGFDCCAFVPVGRNPDVKKVFRDILFDLVGRTDPSLTILDEKQLIDKLREFLENKRYLIVIDDIWDEKLWEFIECAFSRGNNLGSRLIMTTRIVSVSKKCCSSSADSIYEMKPLSGEDSQRLFNRRIFEGESACPLELQEVSRDILKKCGGVPLAIITIASLLASDQHIKPKEEWHILLKSIGRGLTEDASAEEMQRILSFSYYDLPSHLKTCLLYLSIYPEDVEIEKNWLIWKWIAESFVQCERQETSLFEFGETYFNELINRSMIQPVFNSIGIVKACRVHDMVLDLICSLSGEENFVAIMDGNEDITSSQSIARRLSLQNREERYQSKPLVSMGLSQVRCIAVFGPGIALMPPLLSFDVLRVLHLRRCFPSRYRLLKLGDVGKLLHLRYLGLVNLGISELPEEIGNLQFLQVLDLRDNFGLKELPSSVCKLRKLMCLHGCDLKLPNGFGNLTSMEVLKRFEAFRNNVIELRNLKSLRELKISFVGDSSLEFEEALVDSLCNLHNIQSLRIFGVGKILILMGERWVPPRHLRKLVMIDGELPEALPAWMKRNPTLYLDLSKLSICLKEVQQEDLRILGSLPALRYLKLHLWRKYDTRLLFTGADGFQCLMIFELYGPSPRIIMFEPGALPRAEVIKFSFDVRMAKDGDGNADFDFGLGNLLRLREVSVSIEGCGVRVEEVKEAEAAVRHAADIHPNHPSMKINFWPQIPQGAADDYVLSVRDLMSIRGTNI